MNPNLNQQWSEFMDLVIVKKVRRGTTLFSALFVLALSLSAIVSQLGEAGWAVSAFTWSLIFGFAALHLRNKHRMAIWLSINSNDVFWIHPTDHNGLVIDQKFETCGKIGLHMKNGYSFELELDQQTREQLDEWRKGTGVSIKWGPWDDANEPTRQLIARDVPAYLGK